MKKLFNVYCFELGNYFKSKSFVISTVLICLVAIVAMSIPGIIDRLSSGDGSDGEENEMSQTIAICDPQGMIQDDLILSYGKAEIQRMEDEEQVQEAVKAEKAEIGFVVKSASEFDYYVFNKALSDSAGELFKELMSTSAKMKYCQDQNVNYEELMKLDAGNIVCNEKILGKDSGQNYWYSYALVILVFMIIVMYGMMIATSVANEKSNRTVEILVTSTSSSSLLFGKVFAAVTAIIFQMGLIFASILGSYKFNEDSLDGMLDMFFDIPAEVLVTFAVFGLGGFLIYAFMYGAIGSTTSKLEDINTSVMPVTMLFIIAFIVVVFSLSSGTVDNTLLKVCSYIPFTSPIAMFTRIAMSTVSFYEIAISIAILIVSAVGIGIISAKIYRVGVLLYGTTPKIGTVLKLIRKA